MAKTIIMDLQDAYNYLKSFINCMDAAATEEELTAADEALLKIHRSIHRLNGMKDLLIGGKE